MNACKMHLLLIDIRSSLDCNMILVETLRSCNGTDGEYSNMTKSIARHNSRIVTLNNNVTRELTQLKGYVLHRNDGSWDFTPFTYNSFD